VTVSIRKLAATDFAAWEPLWQGYLVFYKTSVPASTTELTFQRLTSGTEPMGGFLAFDGDRAVGMVNWITHRSCWTPGDYCYLQDLFAAPDIRGKGIGRALIEAVYAEAKARGCSRVHWLTHETNTEAMQLYDRIGDKSGFVQYRKIL
jgi:GNAT superfamily N-acetyltransferase